MIKLKKRGVTGIAVLLVGLLVILTAIGIAYAQDSEEKKGNLLEVSSFPRSYSNWTYRMNITIAAGKITENLTDFPLLVLVYNSGLKDYAQDDGDDILFTDNNGNKLNHEIELFNKTYNSTDALLIAWVSVNLSSSSNNVIWMYYNNSQSANQQNSTGVWGKEAVGIYHLKELSGTIYDSTGRAHQSIAIGGTPDYAQAGKIGNAINFDANSNEYINFGDVNDFDFTGNYTICAWFKTTQSASSVGIIGKLTTSPYAGYALQTNSGYPRIWLGNQTGYYYPQGNLTVNDSAWHYFFLRRENGTNTYYIDGVMQATVFVPGSLASTSGFYIGSWGNTAYDYTGLVDEVQLFDKSQSIEWMNATYQNQNNPYGFYSVGNAEKQSSSSEDIPPSVSLDKPIAGYINTTSVYVNLTFNASVSDDFGLANCSLWHNATGTWHRNQTQIVTGTSNTTSFYLNDLTNISFIWNIQCYDNASNYSFGESNRTVEIYFINSTRKFTINFVNPTPLNGATTQNRTIIINATITGNQTLNKLNWNWNGTNYSIYNSSLVFMSNFDNLSAVGDNSSFVADSSPASNNGTIFGGMAATLSGKHNSAYLFDGVNDYIRLSGNVIASGGSYTKIAWIKRGSGNFANNIISGHDMSSTAFWCSNASGAPWNFNLAAGHSGSWGQVIDSVPIEEGVWYFVAVTYDAPSTTLKLYKNGQLVSANYAVAAPGTSTYNYIGSFGGGNLFNGTIDEPRIYNRALSSSEIQELYLLNLQRFNATQWNLYINQSKNATSVLENGTYTYQIFASDNSGDESSSEQRTITIGPAEESGSGNVNFSEFGESPINNEVYTSGQIYYFNVTIRGSNGTAWLEFNGLNYSASNESEVFYASIPSLAAGYYTYRWYAYSNESGNISYSEMRNYVVTKRSSSLNLTLNGSQSNANISEGDSIFINCSLVSPGSDIIELYKGSNLINSGMSPIGNQTLFNDSGSFEIMCYYNGNENYSEISERLWVNVADRDNDAPVIEYGSPSPVNGYNSTKRNIAISNKIYEESPFGKFIFNWNGTNYTIYDNSLKFGTSLDNIPSLGENLTNFADLSQSGNNGTCYSSACPTLSFVSRFNRVDDNTNNLVFMDRFNGDLSNWTVDAYGGQISIVTKDYSKKMLLNDTSSVSYIATTKEFTEPIGNYLIEFDVMYSSGSVVMAQLLDSSDNAIVSLEMGATANTINFSTDRVSGSTATFSAGVYKQVVISVDRYSNVTKVYISEDDGTYGSLQQVGSAKTYSGASISKLKFRTGLSQSGTAYIDEVRIYKPVLAVIGDSITDGKYFWSTHPAYPSGRLSSSSDENSPPNQKILDRICYNCWVANRAFGGSTTTTVNNKIQTALLDHNFSQLYISIGHNDINGGVSIETMKSNFNSIISKAQAMGINGTNIIIANVFPSSALASEPKKSQRHQWNNWLYNRSIELGAVYVDLDSALKDPSNPEAIKSGLSPDGVHLYSAGNDILGDAVAEAVSNANVYHNFKSFFFDGVNDYVNLGNNSDFNINRELSLSAWIKFNTSQSSTSVIAKDGSYRLGIENNKIIGEIVIGGQKLRTLSQEAYNDSAWHSCILSYNGSVLNLYIDGAIDSSNNSLSGSIDISSSNVTIGAQNSSAMFFKGYIDDIRILNRTFSDEEARMFKMSDFRRVNQTSYTFYINLTGVADGLYSYQSFASDSHGNNGQSELRIINVDATLPSSVSNLANQSSGETWIYWNWTNPSEDFSIAIIYLNGTNVANTTNNYYNATGLIANQTYVLTVYTMDAIGNINNSNISSSATTKIDVTAPLVLTTNPSNGGALSAGTTSYTITLTTDEVAECRYSASDDNWSNMTSMQTTNSTTHSVLISGLSDGGNYNYYFLCRDLSNNLMNSSYHLQFSVSSSSSGNSGGGGGGGGGGGSSRTTSVNSTIAFVEVVQMTMLELGGVEDVLMNPGETKTISLKAKNTGTTFLNECRLKAKEGYGSWFKMVSGAKGLAPGEKAEFIFEINLPANVLADKYPLEIALECNEIQKSMKFNVGVVKKNLAVEIVEAKRISENEIKIVYSILELAGKEQNVNIEAVLFGKLNERIADAKNTVIITPKSVNKFEIVLHSDAIKKNNLVSILINANSGIASTFVQENIILDNKGISGLTIFADKEKTDKVITLTLIAGFLVFSFVILRRIFLHKKAEKIHKTSKALLLHFKNSH